jgi:hypothetical protein
VPGRGENCQKGILASGSKGRQNALSPLAV